MELDLEWRVRKSQGLNYRTDIAEFEMERDRLFAQSGGLKDVYMAPHYEDTLGRYVGSDHRRCLVGNLKAEDLKATVTMGHKEQITIRAYASRWNLPL